MIEVASDRWGAPLVEEPEEHDSGGKALATVDRERLQQAAEPVEVQILPDVAAAVAAWLG